MRIHASGTGKTLEEALVKVEKEIQTAALHESEMPFTNVNGKPVIRPEDGRTENVLAPDMMQALRSFGTLVMQKRGFIFRVLVSGSDETVPVPGGKDEVEAGENAHFTMQIDLIKE